MQTSVFGLALVASTSCNGVISDSVGAMGRAGATGAEGHAGAAGHAGATGHAGGASALPDDVLAAQ